MDDPDISSKPASPIQTRSENARSRESDKGHDIEGDGCDEGEETAFEVAGGSDVGRVRETNEDHFLIADLRRLLRVCETNVAHDQYDRLFGNLPGHLLVVADGMGGHHAGEVASSTAVESCARYVLDMMEWFLKLSDDHEKDFLEELTDCLKSVQRKIWRKANGDRDRMGTTVTMGYIVWPRMYLVHAGDSRCYLYRDGEIGQLTTDHTLAQQLVESGALSPEDAATSRWRHVLWNCVGGSQRTVQPEVCKSNLEIGDTIVLCSDGLNAMLSDQEIKQTLESSRSCREAVSSLIDQANKAGGEDNVSVIVGHYHRPEKPQLCDTAILFDNA